MGLKHKWIILVVGAVLLVSCGGKTSPDLSPLASPLASPLHNSATSPLPAQAEVPVFTIDEPLKQGQTTVTGTGPADVPIRIVDVTYMGEELGAGVVDQDDRFSVSVAALPAGHRVGIMLGDVPNRDRAQALQQSGRDIPMIGIILASAMVGE
jgi:hypothetical protein